jgi:16S rRNA (guanine527-N7)-methyltransferase
MEILLKYFSDFTPAQISQFMQLEGLYHEWNAKINMISRKDIAGLYEKHVLHSLAIAAVFEFEKGNKIIDIGTGGGFPGIPLAIFFPQVNFHLADSIGKKLKAVDAIVKELALENVTTEHTRVEEIRNRKFDYAVSRAVAPLKELWKWSKPLVKQGLICLKGGDLNLEIQESSTRPRVMEISEIFGEEYFKEKYILYVAR